MTTLKMTAFRVVDAVTKEVLHKACMSPDLAEERAKKLQKKGVAAIVERVQA